MTYEARIHCWNGTQIIPHDDKNTRGMISVDEYRSDDHGRYGLFDNQGDWQHVPLEQFPADFKLALMLLGIE